MIAVTGFLPLGAGLDPSDAAPAPIADFQGQDLLQPGPVSAAGASERPPVTRPRLEPVRPLEAPGAGLREDVRAVVDAYAAYRDRARAWQADLDDTPGHLEGHREAIAADLAHRTGTPLPDGAPASPPPDLARLLDAREDLVRAARGLEGPASPLARAGPCEVRQPPAVAVDRCGGDSTYVANYALVVDLGGNDTYLNNAGGTRFEDICANSPTPAPVGFAAAALVDVGGDDRYGDPEAPLACGVNGGAVMGAGFLWDRSGDDVYAGEMRGVNGGAWLGGLGYLRDLGGDDRYQAGRRSVTVAEAGARVEAGTWGVNGGSVGGVGTLIDASGDDVYRAGFDEVVIGADEVRVEAGANGVNGGGQVGVGLLVDGNGSDTYAAGIDRLSVEGADAYVLAGRSAVHGGGVIGSGRLVDGGGDDRYRAGIRNATIRADSPRVSAGTDGVAGGGSNPGAVGRLVDAGGSDRYRVGIGHLMVRGDGLTLETAEDGVYGGAVLGADGSLRDLGGDDRYLAGIAEWNVTGSGLRTAIARGGVHGGALLESRGELVDVAGDDRYVADVVERHPGSVPPRFVIVYAVNGGTLSVGFDDPSTGRLVDGGGHDWYRGHAGGTGWDRTVIPKGAAGMQVDHGAGG